ncbi:hypothetical protein MRX96_020178 [Rhipicephalus microplus]
MQHLTDNQRARSHINGSSASIVPQHPDRRLDRAAIALEAPSHSSTPKGERGSSSSDSRASPNRCAESLCSGGASEGPGATPRARGENDRARGRKRHTHTHVRPDSSSIYGSQRQPFSGRNLLAARLLTLTVR